MDPFRSKRLLYRAPEDNPTDDAFFDALYADPHVNRMASHALHRPLSTKERKELRNIIQNKLFLAAVICIIPEPQDDTTEKEPEAIGMLCLRKEEAVFAHNRSLEFGISIATKYQGKGYGPEAISWLLDWSFNSAGLHRVGLQVYEWNERAQKVYEKLGFVHEGRHRESLWRDGRWWDEIQMGILEHEWQAKKKAIGS